MQLTIFSFLAARGLSLLGEARDVPLEILLLLLLLGLIIFMWDFFERRSRSLKKGSGIAEKTVVVSVRGSTDLPQREFYSATLGLSSKPDAIIKEEGFIIPVDIKPMAKKVRDRHVVAMLVHLKLIEEIEGIRPPYGVIIMGKEKRSVRIKNTEDKQRWVDSLLDEMRSIMDGVPAVPAPAPFKCKNCDVREICTFRVDRET